MRRFRRAASILAPLATLLLLAGCSKEGGLPAGPAGETRTPAADAGERDGKPDRHVEAPTTLSPDERRAAGIETARAGRQSIAEELSLTASIQPNQDRLAHVTPPVPGRILRVSAALGDTVRPGMRLATLNSVEAGEARSGYRQAQSDADLARANFERSQRLFDQQIVAQKDYLRARADQEKAQAALRAAAEKLRSLGIAPAASGSEGLSVIPIVAPLAGTVIEKKAVVGELVSGADILFTLADLSVAWIEADVFEKDLAKVKVGAPASVSVAAYPDERFRGRVTYLGGTMNKETRTVKARVEVPNPDRRLKPDMFANVVIATGQGGRQALLLPEDAVVLLQGQPTVFVEAGSGFEARPVTLGETLRGRAEIRAGLEEGETVVVKGAYALKARRLKSELGEGHGH